MRFVRASQLYNPSTGERIAHPDAGASDEEVQEAVDGAGEIVTDGGYVDRCLDCGTRLLEEDGIDSAISREDGRYCYDCVDTPRIAFVGCGSSKSELDDGETVAAKNLYDSTYFSLKQEYAEECCDEWKILSAKHGLLDPETEIGTYDASLNLRSDSYIGDYEAGVWAVETAQEISTYTSFKIPYAQYVVLAGEDYVGHRHIDDALNGLRHVSFPFRQDDLTGIGDQQRWLRKQVDTYHPPGQADLEHYATTDDAGEIVTDGGRPVIRGERTCRFCSRSLRNEPYRCWYFGICRACSSGFEEGSR